MLSTRVMTGQLECTREDRQSTCCWSAASFFSLSTASLSSSELLSSEDSSFAGRPAFTTDVLASSATTWANRVSKVSCNMHTFHKCTSNCWLNCRDDLKLIHTHHLHILILATKSQHKTSNAPSTRNPTADEEEWGQASDWGQYFVSFSTFNLSFRRCEGHPASKKPCHLLLKVLFLNKCNKKTAGNC